MTVNTENFGSILTQMKEAYLEDSTKDFSLASFIGLQSSDLANASQEVKDATKEHEVSLVAFQANEEAQLQANVQELEKGADSAALDAFMRKLKEKQESAKKAAIDMIDNYYAKIENIAKNNPDQASLILILAEKVTEFMKTVLTNLTEIFTKIIEAVVSAIKEAIDFVTSSFKSLANSTAAFFATLF